MKALHAAFDENARNQKAAAGQRRLQQGENVVDMRASSYSPHLGPRRNLSTFRTAFRNLKAGQASCAASLSTRSCSLAATIPMNGVTESFANSVHRACSRPFSHLRHGIQAWQQENLFVNHGFPSVADVAKVSLMVAFASSAMMPKAPAEDRSTIGEWKLPVIRESF